MTDRPEGPDATGDFAGSADFTDFGEDTRKLLGAVQEWTRRTFPAPPDGHGGPECQWCPLCQLAAALRGDHPELTERIAEAGAAIANAVRALAESAPQRGSGQEAGAPDSADAAATTQRHERPTPRPRVQRISLDRTDGADIPDGTRRPDRW